MKLQWTWLNILAVISVLGWNDPSVAMSQHIRCDRLEVSEKSCLLRSGKNTLRIKDAKLMVNNQVWRNIVTLPYSGDGVVWSDARLNVLHKRVFLSLMIWNSPEGEAAIQTLYWLIYEVDAGKAEIRLNKEIQKRRWDSDSSKKLFDMPIAHQMYYSKKNRHVIWKVGKEQGQF